MNTKIYKLVSSILCIMMTVSLVFTGCMSQVDTPEEESITHTSQEEVPDPNPNDTVVISDNIKSEAEDTSNLVSQGYSIGTSEIVDGSEEDEDLAEDEQALEPDAQVEQENISYNGDNTGNGLDLLGNCTGLTYYNQADPRWANKLYTSTGNHSQTMKSSACGPTSAAMVVSSSKGAILPTTMADLFVDNGYRTSSNGTAWACWSFVADYFDFNEYYTTSSDSKMLSYLRTDKNNDKVADYFVVASVGNGLFTTGGHYIVLVADHDGTITVYDPYLYNGKFNKPSRRPAKVKVSGNSVYVTESAFKKYANTKNYWIFSNDYTGTSSSHDENTKPHKPSEVKYTRYISTSSMNLRVRKSASINSSVKTSLKRGTKVIVTKVDGAWSYITKPTTGWVSSQYLSSSPVISSGSSSSNSGYRTSVGKSYKLKSATTLYSKSSLSGTKYQYKAKTTCKVIRHVNSKVDYVLIPATNRYAYIESSKLSSGSSSSTSNTAVKYKSKVNKHYRLKHNTTLYSKSSLSGTKYQYKAKTEVVVLSHYNSSVDKVKCIKTGRIAYCKVSDFV